MARVKASTVIARLQYVESRFGRDARARIVESLMPEHRRVIEDGVLPHQWVSFELFVALNVEIDRAHGKGDLALCEDMGAFGAAANLTTLYRVFYKLGTPMFIFRKAARLWEVHYDSGRLVPTQEGESTVRLKILDFDTPHRAHCLSVLGWATKSIELSGAKVTERAEQRCRTRRDGACELVVGWQ
ncbi:MAG: hypothetical protein IT374_11070 [Polyangiaceae bacterium]|nr:hypothetical protein [Polyangiaceae bacterium]